MPRAYPFPVSLPAGWMLSSDKFPPCVLDLGAWAIPIWVPALINFYGCEHFDILWQTAEAAGAVERDGCKWKTVYIFRVLERSIKLLHAS